jgi:hemerythrin
MSMFAWKNEYSIGYSEIDAQHKSLFALANDLHSAMTLGKGEAAMSETLGNVIEYIKIHFASEERLMRTNQYPEYADHKAAHDALTAQVVALEKDFEDGRGGITVGLLQFLKDWHHHHIGGTDRKIADFLKTKAAA